MNVYTKLKIVREILLLDKNECVIFRFFLNYNNLIAYIIFDKETKLWYFINLF